MLFSERHGYDAPKTILERESMPDALRHQLWNSVDTNFCQLLRGCITYDQLWGVPNGIAEPGASVAYWLWNSYFGLSWDQTGQDPGKAVVLKIRAHLMECEWHSMYSFLELVARILKAHWQGAVHNFIAECDAALERQGAAWRFAGLQIVDITSQEEIGAIRDALGDAECLPGVRAHIEQALRLYKDQGEPDYRNSFKESISAVEAIACIIAGDAKADLGRALDVIERTGRIEFHGALKKAIDTLYGYASDEQGVRHKMIGESAIGRAEAQFMLVACCGLVSYLKAKALESGIDLEGAS